MVIASYRNRAEVQIAAVDSPRFASPRTTFSLALHWVHSLNFEMRAGFFMVYRAFYVSCDFHVWK
jgi:hypothetical protein